MSNQKYFGQWNRIDWLILVIISIPIFISIIVYKDLPEQMAVHFGIEGNPNRFQNKLSFLITFSIFVFVMAIFIKVLKNIDPRSKNYIKFDKAFNMTRLALATLLSGVYIFILVFNLGYALDIKMVTLLSTGFLFLVIGNYLGQIRPTYFVGIRTPWTLANDEVWRKTHRLGGPLMMLSGLVLIGAAFLPGTVAMWLSALSILVSVLVPTIYSYVLYAKSNKQS